MNFYQSELRRYISTEIFRKPTFDMHISGQQLFGIDKTQVRMRKELHRFMVHGVERELSKDRNEEFVMELKSVSRDYKKGWGDIFFQRGLMTEMGRWSTKEVKKNKELAGELAEEKKKINEQMWNHYALLPSWREHMPDATIVLDMTLSEKELVSGYSTSCKRYINKAKKADVTYAIAEKKDWDEFWLMRHETAYDKGFHVLPKDIYIELMEYLLSSGQGYVYLAWSGSKIVAGNVMLKRGSQMIYLYGAARRIDGVDGAHYGLMDHLIRMYSHDDCVSFDFLGVSPPDRVLGHYLQGVTRFKQSFGGETIVYVGNYDLVFNSVLYRLMQGMRSLKK